MPQLEIDSRTARALEFAARMAHVSPGQLVARLVDQASRGEGQLAGAEADDRVGVCADYAGFRTKGLYDSLTGRIDVVAGPLEGRSFKTPSSAARAVVEHYKPGVSPQRNGWSFWMLDDGSSLPLQSIRHSAPAAGHQPAGA